jgi:hypothetical protein
MSDFDKIKITVLPTGTMHADLTWLLINPANMATISWCCATSPPAGRTSTSTAT